MPVARQSLEAERMKSREGLVEMVVFWWVRMAEGAVVLMPVKLVFVAGKLDWPAGAAGFAVVVDAKGL